MCFFGGKFCEPQQNSDSNCHTTTTTTSTTTTSSTTTTTTTTTTQTSLQNRTSVWQPRCHCARANFDSLLWAFITTFQVTIPPFSLMMECLELDYFINFLIINAFNPATFIDYQLCVNFINLDLSKIFLSRNLIIIFIQSKTSYFCWLLPYNKSHS